MGDNTKPLSPNKEEDACSLDSVVATLRAIVQTTETKERVSSPVARPVRFRKYQRFKKSKSAVSSLTLPSIPLEGNPYLILLQAIGDYYGIELSVLCSKSRKQPAARVCQIYMHLMKRALGVPQIEIGRVFGYDHTSVKYGYDKIAALRAVDQGLDAQLRELEERLLPLKEKSAPFVKIPDSPLTQEMRIFMTEQRATLPLLPTALVEIALPEILSVAESSATSERVLEIPAGAPIPVATETVAIASVQDSVAVEPPAPRAVPPWASLASSGWEKTKEEKHGNNG